MVRTLHILLPFSVPVGLAANCSVLANWVRLASTRVLLLAWSGCWMLVNLRLDSVCVAVGWHLSSMHREPLGGCKDCMLAFFWEHAFYSVLSLIQMPHIL